MSERTEATHDRELIEAHSARLDEGARSELERLGMVLQAQSAETVRHALQFSRPRADSVGRAPLLGGWCRTLEPVFSIESPPVEESTSGGMTRYARADADAGTLDAGAATGQLANDRYPSSETFILGFNRASASLGASVHLGPHGPNATLEVSVELEIVSWPDQPEATFTGSGLGLLFINRGNEDLPLRGTSVAWCRAGLTLVGRAGKTSGVGIELASAWVNRDGASSVDGAPDGVITLVHRVVLHPELIVAGIFVSLSAFAGAEESEEPFLSAFAQVSAFPGAFPPFLPSRIHLRSIRARICEPSFSPTASSAI